MHSANKILLEKLAKNERSKVLLSLEHFSLAVFVEIHFSNF